MTTAPDMQAYHLDPPIEDDDAVKFFLSPASGSREESSRYCTQHGSRMYTVQLNQDGWYRSKNEQQVLRYMRDIGTQEPYLWIANSHENVCAMMGVNQGSVIQVPCSETNITAPGLCITDDPDSGDLLKYVPFIYSCQCKKGYGYENCTKVSSDYSGPDRSRSDLLPVT